MKNKVSVPMRHARLWSRRPFALTSGRARTHRFLCEKAEEVRASAQKFVPSRSDISLISMLLSPSQDPMGAAIADYHRHGTAQPLWVHSSLFDDDELPAAHLFRTPMQMPLLEREALRHCRGHVLDVGAGAGSHTLALQTAGHRVTAIDISPLSVEVMRERGVEDARTADFFDDDLNTRFDTILMMMNGIGICGGLNELPRFFARLDQLLTPGGQVLTDSCDLAYIYEDEDGHIDLPDVEGYYGEVDYRMSYGGLQGPAFNWLYIDFDTLAHHAAQHGYRATSLRQGDNCTYLARLERIVQ